MNARLLRVWHHRSKLHALEMAERSFARAKQAELEGLTSKASRLYEEHRHKMVAMHFHADCVGVMSSHPDCKGEGVEKDDLVYPQVGHLKPAGGAA